MIKFALIGIALLIYSAMTFYLGYNIKIWGEAIRVFPPPVLFWTAFFIISFSIFIGRLHASLHWFSVVGNYWMFVVQYGLILFIFANIFIAVTPWKNVGVIGSVVAIVFVLLFVIGTYNAYSPVTKNLQVTIDKKGEDLRLVVASDFHLGMLSNKKHLARFVELSNEAKPDVVLLVGDIVDDNPLWFVAHGMSDVMKQLETTHGVYGVLGNHEYYGGEIPLFIKEMHEADVRILVDETILIGNSFYLTGREDLTNKHREELAHLMPKKTDVPWLVMDHTPSDIETPATLGVDMHFSGHTHRGQMWPGNLITKRMFELDYGYAQKEQMHALVSSGFGFWGPPTRINTRAELWVVDITFTQK